MPEIDVAKALEEARKIARDRALRGAFEHTPFDCPGCGGTAYATAMAAACEQCGYSIRIV